MNEQLPTPSNPTNPEQDQLFNPDLYTVEAENTARVQELYESFSNSSPDFEAGEQTNQKLLNEQEELTHRNLLAQLQGVNGDVPEPLQLKRDWSDSRKQHEEKQAQHVKKVAGLLEGRLIGSDQAHQSQHEQAAYQLKVDQHNDKIAARENEAAERKTVRDAYINRQKLLRGERQAELFADEISAEADAHVEKTLGTARHAHEGVVDTTQLKEERKREEAAANATPERAWERTTMRQFQHRGSEEDPNTTLLIEFTKKGDVLEWSDKKVPMVNREDREILILSKDGSLVLIRGNQASKLETDGQAGIKNLVQTRLESIHDMADTTIGEPWELSKDIQLSEVETVLIKRGKMNATEATTQGIEKTEFNLLAEVAKMVKALEAKNLEAAGAKQLEDDEALDTSPKGLRARIRAKMSRAAEAVRDSSMWAALRGREKDSGFFKDPETSKRRRVAAVAGAVAVAGVGVAVAYLASKGNPGVAQLVPGKSNGGTLFGAVLPRNGRFIEQISSILPQTGTTRHVAQHAHDVMVKSGDNPWTIAQHVEQSLGIPNPSKAQVLLEDRHIEHLNHLNEVTSRLVQPGTKLKV